MIRPDVAVEIGRGHLVLNLVQDEALLTLQSGYLRSLTAGMNITLNADDIEFLSGVGRVVGLASLTLRTNKNVSSYYIGTAAEDIVGAPFIDGSPRQIANHGFYFGNRDLAAIYDGFTDINVGRRDIGNVVWLGDVKDSANVKMLNADGDPVPRAADSIVASFRDDTNILSDTVNVVGDVEAPLDTLSVYTRRLEVNSQNGHDPNGSGDSGLYADALNIQVDEQAVVMGWLKAVNRIDFDVTKTPGDAGVSDAYFTPPYLATGPLSHNSIQVDSIAEISTSADASLIQITAKESIEVRGRIEVGGNGSTIEMAAEGPMILVELARVFAEGANSTIEITTDDVLAVNAGSSVRSGAKFVSPDPENFPDMLIDPVITGANGTLNLLSSGEMLLAGSVTASGDMTLSAKSQKYDDEVYGRAKLVGGADNPEYSPRYTIFNKTAYFENIAAASPTHYLVDHAGGYGLLVTGTVTSLGDNQNLIVRADQDVIVRGNLNATGANAGLTLQSNEWLYLEGFVTATDTLNLFGGVTLEGEFFEDPFGRADDKGSSVYIHPTSTVRTTAHHSDISVIGAMDVDLFGALVAGGEITENGVDFAVDANGDGASNILVKASQQVWLETGLLASGNVTIEAGYAGLDDYWNGAFMDLPLIENMNAVALLINTSGGITAAGLGDSGAGSQISISSEGRMEIMGTLVSGGRIYQTFGDVDTDGDPETPAETVLLEQGIRWTGRESDLSIESDGRVFIGGTTLNAANVAVQTGGYLNASREINVAGGTDDSGFGLIVHGASEIVAEGTWDYAASGAQTGRTAG
ncbi:MAG: hypothetical protein ACO31Z_09475, partial [Litorivicinaceae bacterium]